MGLDGTECPETEDCVGGMLGGPTPDEELRYGRHLAECEICAAEWHDLADFCQILRQTLGDLDHAENSSQAMWSRTAQECSRLTAW
jgi:hypothetical protein